MANKVLVFLEQRNGKIKKSSFEAAKTGAELAAKLGSEIEAVVIGNEVENISEAGGYGVKKVIHLKNNELSDYSADAYKNLIAEYCNESGVGYLVFANTSMGKDLAPRLSAKLDAGLAMDIISFDVENDKITATRPIYGGKALIDLKITSDKAIISIRPNVFNAGESTNEKAEVIVKEVTVEIKSKVTEVKKAGDILDVAEAEIIVSGGRGLKEAEKFKIVEDLAQVLGAAVGASRAVVDADWRPHNEQVGQTGKTVSPNLYIALGISGAIQHLAGMRSSKYIVAVNKDPDAPIFQIADYGITGDVFDVVPVMIEEIKKVKNG